MRITPPNRRLGCLLAGVAWHLAGVAGVPAASPDQIVTGPERSTYIQFGRDLSSIVAKPAGLTLQVEPSKGSVENLRRLPSDPRVLFALVQSDVYQAFLDQAAAGSAEAERLIKPLRVVMPLYDEEIYFVVRADSPLNAVQDIKDKRINVGPVGSGVALTATTLYRQMFGKPIVEKNATFLSNEDALLKLASDKSIDVAVVVEGQPAKLFADMKKEAAGYIKLLKFDPQALESQAAGSVYQPGIIRAASYPTWLAEDVPALTIKSLLMTYNFQTPAAQQTLGRFADSLCTHFDQLQSAGHAKWQSVQLSLPPLGKGWEYYEPSSRKLAECIVSRARSSKQAALAAAKARSCPQEKLLLGLCR
jgi:TRAP transporter TAXI family solute receptor